MPAIKDRLRLFFWLVGLLPLGYLSLAFVTDTLGSNPIERLTDLSGMVSLCLLLISLSVSPILSYFHAPQLFSLRRISGLLAAVYGFIHGFIFIALDWQFDWPAIILEISSSWHLITGSLALALLLPLVVTSNRMSKLRLGLYWKRLHKLHYLIIGLAIGHFLLLVKADRLEPILFVIMLLTLLMLRKSTRWIQKLDTKINPLKKRH